MVVSLLILFLYVDDNGNVIKTIIILADLDFSNAVLCDLDRILLFELWLAICNFLNTIKTFTCSDSFFLTVIVIQNLDLFKIRLLLLAFAHRSKVVALLDIESARDIPIH